MKTYYKGTIVRQCGMAENRKLTDEMDWREQNYTHISIYTEHFFTKLPKQFNEKGREYLNMHADTKGQQVTNQEKEGSGEEGRREIEEGKGKGKGWKGKENKRREKKKSQHFTLNHIQRVIYTKYLTDLNIGAKTRKLHKKTGLNIHDNSFAKNSFMKPKA